MKKIRFLAAAALFCAAVLCSCSGNRTMLFGTGNMGGNYYSYGNALSQLIIADDSSRNITVKTTSGSAANLRLIQQGFLDIAIAQSDTLIEAYCGGGSFAALPCKGVRAIAGLYTEECQIIVRADSDINSVADLYGRKVSVGETESGVMKNAEQILFVNGLSFDMIEKHYLSFSDSAAALESGSIDAFFVTAGAPTTAVAELARNLDIRLIPLDEKTVSKITNEYAGYTACTIPAGTYRGQDEDIPTVGVKAVLVAGNKVSDDSAKRILSTLFGHSNELRYAANTAELSIDFAVSDIPVPFHGGAAAWYSENGVTVSTEAEGTVGHVSAFGQD